MFFVIKSMTSSSVVLELNREIQIAFSNFGFPLILSSRCGIAVKPPTFDFVPILNFVR